MVFHFRTVHVALVPVPAEVVVRIGLVVANVTDILLIIQNTSLKINVTFLSKI